MTTRKKPQISSSSSNHWTQNSEFKFLPLEIWTQILAKLPAKTLLKFRSGCLLTVRDAETLRETGFICMTDLYSYHIMGSCNGLFLVGKEECYPVKELRLWNPCIRKSLLIPACPFPSSLLKYCVYVFGYAPVSKDYKVVAFASGKGVGEEPRTMYVAVYALREQQWSVRNDGLNFSVLTTFQGFYCIQAAVFLKGVAYWLENIDKDRFQLTHLGSFDFEKEEITLSELPSSCDGRHSRNRLFLLGESLAIFRISEVASSIWVLDQDNKKGPWTRRFSGKSSHDGYELFRCFIKQKVFFCESDGGYLICGNKSSRCFLSFLS